MPEDLLIVEKISVDDDADMVRSSAINDKWG